MEQILMINWLELSKLLKMKKSVFYFLTFFLLFNISIANGQSFSIKGLENRHYNNSLTAHLATAKLCDKFYDGNDIIEERNNKSSYKMIGGFSDYGCHVCVEVIQSRHANYFELFVDHFLKDKRIQKNRTNAFTVRTLREEINAKYLEDYNKLVDSIDTENLVFYNYDLIGGYSFDTNELYISMFNPRFNSGLTANKGKLIISPNLKDSNLDVNSNLMNGPQDYLGSFRISMNEEKAQKIYDRYKNHFSPNPPFGIGTKIHYSLRMGEELNGQIRNFIVVLKKVEFFIPNEQDIKNIQRSIVKVTDIPENKIAEIVFNEKLYYNKIGYPYQEIKSQKVF
jgi:hypothetical protein